jgi:hypothetical protein
VDAVGASKPYSAVLHGARVVVVVGLEAVGLIAHRLVASVGVSWGKLALGTLLVCSLLVVAVPKRVAWLLAVEAEAVLNAPVR